MNKKFTKLLAALALLVFMTPSLAGWGQTVSENDVLWTEPFAGSPSNSTTFSETTSWDDYINPTTFVTSDASLLSYTSSNAMANSGTATNMEGAHVWLNKSVNSYIQISGIKLYNTTKVKISWAQATSGSSTTVYYQFDGTGDFTSLSTCSGPNANFESSELSVANHTTIALKFFHPSSNSKNTRIDNLKLTATEVAGGAPSISANNVNIAYDATEGAIEYTINNPVQGGLLSAQVSTGSWITLGTVGETVPFTCEANTSSAARTETVTLTYSYGDDQTVTKDVTVTQAGNPDVFDNISSINATGTFYRVRGTVVALNSRGCVVGDGTGYINFYNGYSAPSGVAVGDNVTVSGNMTSYGHIYQFSNYSPNSATIEAAESSNYNGTPAISVITEIPTATYSEGLHLSDYFQFEGTLTKSSGYYYVSCGEGNINIAYPSSTQQTAMNALENKTVRAKGYFAGINSSSYFSVILASVEEVANPSITATPSPLTVPSYVVGTAEPEYETLTVSGSNLTANISLTLNANSNFEMSTDLETWSSSLTLAQASGSVTNEEVAIRLKAGLAKGSYVGTVTLSSTDAQDVVVNLSGSVTGQTYDIVLMQPTGGTIAADLSAAEEGATVTLTATPDAAYNFGAWVVEDEDENPITVTDNQFEMPASDVLVTATFTLKDTYAITCAVTPDDAALLEASPASAYEGQTVTLTYTAETGYSLSGIVITKTSDGSATGITPTASGDDFTFTMPGYAVTATATFLSDTYIGSFVKFTGSAMEEGDYILVYNQKAMNNDNTTTSNKLGATDVNISTNNIITDPSRSIVWHIAPIGTDGKWTIHNDIVNKYVNASGSGNTNITFVDNASYSNGAKWSVTIDEDDNTYDFNSLSTSRALRYYNSVFGHYATNNGGPLTLYKYTVLTEPSITVADASVAANDDNCTMAITYQNMTISDMTDFTIQFCDSEGNNATQPSWITEATAAEENGSYMVSCVFSANTGDERTAYLKVSVGQVTSNVATLTQAAYVAPPTPGNWVLTSLADLTENDIFVIVGTYEDMEHDSYAMSNDKGTSNAPEAVSVTIVENTLSGEPAANIQWKVSGNATDGYTFYPNGSTETWLYCTNTNDGVRVGTNNNKTFIVEDGYLKHVATSRFVGVYNTQDWRCYTSGPNHQNIGNQSFAFYKKVTCQTFTFEADKWYLISPPTNNDGVYDLGDLITDQSYALYSFNQDGDEEGKEWINYKGSPFTLEVGQGYLYANDNGCTLTYCCEISTGSHIIQLINHTVNANSKFHGLNLIGNPFGVDAYIDTDVFYVMAYNDENPAGEVIAATPGSAIAPMQGVFVYATDEYENAFLTTTAPSKSGSQIALNVTKNRGSVIDRAIVHMGEGRQMPKFQLFENSTKVYIPQNGKDYAVVRSEGQGELPVNFRAAENGTYTLSMDVENMDMNYLHLIDNMTGMDIDLLQTPSYTFEANTRDYESRFRLVFAGNNANADSDNFAFFSNGNLIINNEGNATLQVIDLNGRILSSESVNGSVSTTLNATPGVYMLRLINGDNVKVQKVVVR